MDRATQHQVEAFCPDLENPFSDAHECTRDDLMGLNPEGVANLREEFQRCGLNKEAAAFLAGQLPCEYLRDLEEARENIRPSRMKEDFETIEKAADALYRALKSSSRQALEVLADALRDEWAEMRIEDSPLSITREMFPWNAETLFALGDLSEAAKSLKEGLPKDNGGPVAGRHDATGASVRKSLALRLRRGFKILGLGYGAQANGPIAGSLRYIHEAAIGVGSSVDPCWPKKCAEQVPGWERFDSGEMRVDGLCEYEEWLSDPKGMYQTTRDERLESYRREMKLGFAPR